MGGGNSYFRMEEREQSNCDAMRMCKTWTRLLAQGEDGQTDVEGYEKIVGLWSQCIMVMWSFQTGLTIENWRSWKVHRHGSLSWAPHSSKCGEYRRPSIQTTHWRRPRQSPSWQCGSIWQRILDLHVGMEFASPYWFSNAGLLQWYPHWVYVPQKLLPCHRQPSHFQCTTNVYFVPGGHSKRHIYSNANRCGLYILSHVARMYSNSTQDTFSTASLISPDSARPDSNFTWTHAVRKFWISHL